MSESYLYQKNQTNFGGYSKDYVRELENEIVKLTQENIFLRSDQYKGTVSSSDDQLIDLQRKVIELEEKVKQLTQENQNFKSDDYKHELLKAVYEEQESIKKKINLLCVMIRKISFDSDERESILAELQQILDQD